VEVENFVRGGNPDKMSQGEVLWKAAFDGSPKFEQRVKRCGRGQSNVSLEQFTPPFAYGACGPERPDSDYLERAFLLDWGSRDKALMKWCLNSRATITPAKRGRLFGDQGFLLEVFAKGTSVCDYDWEQGDGSNGRWKQEVKEYVDTVCFNLVQLSTGQPVATWSVAGDFDATSGDLFQQNPLFQLTMAGGWFAKTKVLKTAEHWDPVLALIVGYLCAFEYSPQEIKADLKSNFPNNPNSSW